MCKYVLLLASFGCLINSYSEEVLSASNLSSWRRSHVGSFLSVKSSKRFARGVFDISQCFILCLFKGDCVFDISQCFILCLFKARWHYSSIFDTVATHESRASSLRHWFRRLAGHAFAIFKLQFLTSWTRNRVRTVVCVCVFLFPF